MLWPLFARAPCHWLLEMFLLSFPGAQSIFCFVAPRWAPIGRGRRSAVGRRAGPEQKENTTQGVFVFLLRPRACGQRRFSIPCLSAGAEQKNNTLGGVFLFALAPPTGLGAQRGATKKNTLHDRERQQNNFLLLFCCGPAQTLTHSLWAGATLSALRAWAAMPPVGGRRGSVFVLLRPRPDAHSLTAGLGGDASRRGRRSGVVFFFVAAVPPGPGWCFFFAAAPYIGSKRPGGATAKTKNTTSNPKTLNPKPLKP